MTQRESPEQVRTLITSNRSAAEVSPLGATYGSVISGQTNLTTGNSLDRANIPPSVLRDLWVTKFGDGWVDASDIPNDYYAVQRQLWFAGMLQKMHRPDIGREVWSITNANTR